MQVYDWTSVTHERINPLFARQVIHTDTMTIARVHLSKGCSVQTHSHHNEQVSMVEKGSVRFVLDGKERIVKAGEILHIPANVPHSAETADADAIVVDLFSPPRQDWINGDDAYLRK